MNASPEIIIELSIKIIVAILYIGFCGYLAWKLKRSNKIKLLFDRIAKYVSIIWVTFLTIFLLAMCVDISSVGGVLFGSSFWISFVISPIILICLDFSLLKKALFSLLASIWFIFVYSIGCFMYDFFAIKSSSTGSAGEGVMFFAVFHIIWFMICSVVIFIIALILRAFWR
ncbi:MAG: hypothetical protein FJZ09_01000 [Candidatus Omnitrophica bacterium]|nr:hypothetical protein [Candidatus Omnitrophota bacterium]